MAVAQYFVERLTAHNDVWSRTSAAGRG